MLSSKPHLAHRHNHHHESQSSLGQQGPTAGRNGTKDFGAGALTRVQHMTTSCQGDQTHKLCQCDGYNVNYASSSILLASPQENSGKEHTSTPGKLHRISAKQMSNPTPLLSRMDTMRRPRMDSAKTARWTQPPQYHRARKTDQTKRTHKRLTAAPMKDSSATYTAEVTTISHGRRCPRWTEAAVE